MWRDDLTITGQSKRAPPRIVLILVLVIPPSAPAGGTVGEERGVCGEFVLDIEVPVAAGKAANLEGERPLPSIARFRTASISDARGGNKPRCART